MSDLQDQIDVACAHFHKCDASFGAVEAAYCAIMEEYDVEEMAYNQARRDLRALLEQKEQNNGSHQTTI